VGEVAECSGHEVFAEVNVDRLMIVCNQWWILGQ